VFLIQGSLSNEPDDCFDDSDIVEIDIQCADGVAVVKMAGELDISNSEWLDECLHEVVAAGNSEVVVDVERLAFMDSTGLAVIVGAHKRLKAAGGSLTVVGAAPIIMRLFYICDDIPHLMTRHGPSVSRVTERHCSAPIGAQ
jgi:anti-anti-sigma factor